MASFWKFNVFVGSVGVLLIVAALYGTQHTVNLEPNHVFSLSASFDLAAKTLPSLAFVVGFGMVVYQLITTGLGLLAGFFRAPSGR